MGLVCGSNANGNYVKFADGTQICIAQKTVTVSITPAGNGIGWSTTLIWTYPASFSSDVVFGSIGGWYKAGVAEGWAQTNALRGRTNFRLVGTATISQEDVQVVLLAIGKWK